MPAMPHPAIDAYLALSLAWFFFVFGIVGFAVGVGLISSHVRMQRFFALMNRWVSMRRGTKWLAIPRDSGLTAPRFRRAMGGAFILLAVYSTFILITQIDAVRIAAMLRIDAPRAFVAWIVESLRWFLIVGSLVAIAVGIMLVFFGNALRAIETRANRWYSFRSHSQTADAMHMGFDRWVERYPRALGGVIALAALVVVVDFWLRLLAPH